MPARLFVLFLLLSRSATFFAPAISADESPPPAKPYSATIELKHVQVLLDGTTVTTVRALIVARDSAGRTVYQITTPRPGRDPLTITIVYDTPGHHLLRWNSESNTVIVRNLNASAAAEESQPSPNNLDQSSSHNTKVEHLGHKIMLGLDVEAPARLLRSHQGPKATTGL
jgi:hypothetical protein